MLHKEGWPSCCSEPGGDEMNCPNSEPDCDKDNEEVATAVKYLRAKQ